VEVAVGPPDSSRGVVRARAAAIGPGRYAADSGVSGRGEWLVAFEVRKGEDALRLERTLRSGGDGGEPCDLGEGPCTLPLPGGVAVTLELGPRPLRTMAELAAVASVISGGQAVAGAAVEVAISMPGMEMGRNSVALRDDGAGRHLGRVTVVRCMSGRKDWVAEVTVARPGAEKVAARFPFSVVE
jgi:hypothetical protein